METGTQSCTFSLAAILFIVYPRDTTTVSPNLIISWYQTEYMKNDNLLAPFPGDHRDKL